jgi:NAD(P)H-flavin reductase
MRHFCKNATIDEVFICGPEEMILAVKDKMIGVWSSLIRKGAF